MKLGIQVAGKTDVGRVRTNNEDNFGFDIRKGIFVVCDGMGGRAAGERASQIAVETVLGYFQHDLQGADTQILGKTFESVSQRANALGRAIQLANQAILEEAARNPVYAGMGSTIVAVLVEGNLFSLANVGDNPGVLKSTLRLCPDREDAGKSQTTAAKSRAGYETAERSPTETGPK